MRLDRVVVISDIFDKFRTIVAATAAAASVAVIAPTGATIVATTVTKAAPKT